MDQAALVGVLEGAPSIRQPAHAILQGRAGADLAQRPSFHQLHGDERRAVLFADVVDHDGVRMIELGRGARFPQQASGELRSLHLALGHLH